jgi:hypothetical protein
VFVADQDLPGVLTITGGRVEVFFQADKKYTSPLNGTRCVALDRDGSLLVGDAATREVYRFDAKGKPSPLTGGVLGIPVDIAVDAEGNLVVSDRGVGCIWQLPKAGGRPKKFASLRAPRGLTIAADGTLWVVSLGEDQLVRISPDGRITPVVKGRVFEFPHDVVLDEHGVAYVSDGYASAIWKVERSGKTSKWLAGSPLSGPVGLNWHGDKLLVSDPKAKNVFEVARDGKVSPLVK